MPSQHKPDEIIGMLCETTIVLAQGGAIAVACGLWPVPRHRAELLPLAQRMLLAEGRSDSVLEGY